jgi:hypothetical protein
MKFSIFEFLSTVEFYTLLALIVLGAALAKYLPPGFFEQDWGGMLKNFWLILPEYAVLVMFRLFFFSFFLSLILVIGVIVVSHRIIQTRKKMDEIFVKANKSGEEKEENVPEPIINDRWMSVVKHINSENPSDWKLAILECDIMLGDILEKMGYMQESIGEKLKSVEPSDFTNIESAWEAHKIRNTIAHEGSEFLISHKEAKRVIGLYEVVFREFAFI